MKLGYDVIPSVFVENSDYIIVLKLNELDKSALIYISNKSEVTTTPYNNEIKYTLYYSTCENNNVSETSMLLSKRPLHY